MIDWIDSHVLLALSAWPVAAAAGIFLLRGGRSAALAASVFELVLACWAWVRMGMGVDLYRPIDWVRAEAGVDLALRIDPISGLAVLVVSVMAVMAMALPRPGQQAPQRGYYELLLIVTAGMVGLHLAGDMIVLLAMLLAVLLAMLWLNSRYSRSRRMRGDMRRFIALYAGWLVMLVAIFRWAWLHYEQSGLLSFSYDDLLTYMPPIAESDGLWTMLFAAAVSLFGLSGAYWILHPIGRRLPLASRVLVIDALRWSGLVIVARVLLPIWPRAGEASVSPYFVLAVAAAAGVTLATVAAIRRGFRPFAGALLVLWNSGICLLLLLRTPWSVDLGLAMGGVELAVKVGLLLRSRLSAAQMRRLLGWTFGAVFAAGGCFLAVRGWALFAAECDRLIELATSSHEIPGKKAFDHRNQATTGLVSMLGVVCWAMGIFSIRPFARSLGRADREVVLWRLAGPALIQMGLALYLLDGVCWRMPHHVEPYMSSSLLLDPPRAGIFIGVHLLLVILLSGLIVGYLRLAGWKANKLDDLAGLGRRHPGTAAALTVAGLSLFALPGTAGFWSTLAMFGLRTAWHSRSLLGLPLLFVLPISAFAAIEPIQCALAPSRKLPRSHVPLGPAATTYRCLMACLAAAIVLLGVLPQILAEPVEALLKR